MLTKAGLVDPAFFVISESRNLPGFPEPEDEPPAYDGEVHWGEIIRFCPNRHNGFVNGLFYDWSVKKVGLKELWKLKWHREFNINGMWTIAGFGGREDLCAAEWDRAAPWMSKFPEY